MRNSVPANVMRTGAHRTRPVGAAQRHDVSPPIGLAGAPWWAAELGARAELAGNLSRAAAVAAQTFETWEEATQAILEIVMGLLGMRSVFLTRVDLGTNPACLRVVAARNAPGEFAVPVGHEAPIQETV